MISLQVRSPSHSSSGRLKNFLCAVLLGASLLGVNSCSWFSSDDDAPKTRDPLAKGAATQGPAAKNLTDPDGNTMSPPMGLVNKKLFAEKLHDDDDRFDRLENAVQAMRDELNGVTPSVTKLQGMQGDMQELVSQLQVLAKANSEITPSQLNNDQGAINKAMGVNAPQEAVAAPAPVAAPAVPTPPHPAIVKAKPAPVAATAKVSSGDLSLVNVRVADNGAKTRLVLESAGSLPYKADLDNDEHILTLTFAKGTMGTDVAKLALHSKLVKSVSGTAQNSGGFVLAFALNKNSKIAAQGVIAPDGNNPHNRVWIDLSN